MLETLSREKSPKLEIDEENLSLARNLKELRLALSRERPEFRSVKPYADWLDVPNATYDNWEKGRRSAPAIAIKKIAAKTGASIRWLVFNIGEMFESGTVIAGEDRQDEGKRPRGKVVSRCGATVGNSGQVGNLPSWGVSEEAQPYAPNVATGEARASAERLAGLLRDHELWPAGESERTERSPPPLLVVAGSDLSPETRRALRDEREHIRVVPILAGEIAAGAPRCVWEQEVEGWAFCHASAVAHPESTSCVRVRGESMAPAIPDGALAGVDHAQRDAREWPAGTFAAVRGDDGGVAVRGVTLFGRMLICRPLNPGADHPEMAFDLAESENPVAGRVVWVWAGY